MSERIYAGLLRLYPSAFRAKYQEEALQLYRERLRDEAGMLRRSRLYCDLLLDGLIALPQVWRNSYASTGSTSLASTAGDLPSFRLLDTQPLRPSSVLIGSSLSFAALSIFAFLMSLPAPFRGSATRLTAIESVMERLNHTLSPGNGDQVPAPRASMAATLSHLQDLTDNDATHSRLDEAERNRVVQSVSENLLAHYFDRESSKKASDALLSHSQQGEYDALNDGPTLAARLTADIQNSTQDRHLDVLFSAGRLPDGPRTPSPAAQEQYRSAMKELNCAFEKVGILPHKIGYLKINFFPDPAICGSVAHAALAKMSQADAIIFDLRDSRGGEPEMVAEMAAPLFDHPVSWYNPRATPSAGTLAPEPGSKLADKPVYILTSSSTYSGAEHFTYDLKMLKRATVVGETTGGGTHLGTFHRIDDHFGIGIPENRITNPYGGPDWAVTGVEPDVKVKAADALATAEKLALEHRKD